MNEQTVNPNVPVIVSIDLSRICENVQAIRQKTGVEILAVVKADAYGLGALKIAEAIADLVDGFYVFDSSEAVAADLPRFGRRIIALNSAWNDPVDFLSRKIHPVVWAEDRARELRQTKPVLSIDTGQQRFACPVENALAVARAGNCHEVMTHATKPAQVGLLLNAVSSWNDHKLFLHAAGSALLDDPAARLNAVRPGLAIYQGAVSVHAKLIDVRDSNGPAGYTGFVSPRFGIILAGYSNGIRRGPCRVNGELRQVLEVGMQSSFVELGPKDHTGDEVVLLGDGMQLSDVANAWQSSQQETLLRLCGAGVKKYHR